MFVQIQMTTRHIICPLIFQLIITNGNGKNCTHHWIVSITAKPFSIRNVKYLAECRHVVSIRLCLYRICHVQKRSYIYDSFRISVIQLGVWLRCTVVLLCKGKGIVIFGFLSSVETASDQRCSCARIATNKQKKNRIYATISLCYTCFLCSSSSQLFIVTFLLVI